MATESVAGNEILPSLPEPDTDQENNENGETCESCFKDRIQDEAQSVPNTESIYQSQLILNILTVASANTQSVSRHARYGELNRGNRWQELKTLIQRHTSRIRSSRMLVFYFGPPVFDPSSEDYCAKDFCTYIKGMNIIVSPNFFKVEIKKLFKICRFYLSNPDNLMLMLENISYSCQNID
ncbi:UNVERIFIED_CONTAM: hypothetical protein NCL1_13038 [Trichonephila clavipes]